MQTTFCFIRHGRTQYNIDKLIQGRLDNPLTKQGENDAKIVADLIKEHNLEFDVIISSPLSRAISTANIVRNEINHNHLDIIKCDYFIERDFGEADGKEINDENYQKVLNDDFLGMEKSYDICKRTKEGLEYLLKTYPGKRILVVCHSHVIKSLFMQYDENVKFNSTFGHHSINLINFTNEDFIFENCKFNINKK